MLTLPKVHGLSVDGKQIHTARAVIRRDPETAERTVAVAVEFEAASIGKLRLRGEPPVATVCRALRLNRTHELEVDPLQYP